jgi:hypothetical protein
VSGNFVYVAALENGLRIVDVSNPTSPTEVGFFATPGPARNVAVNGNYAYVSVGVAGLRILDVSDPANPSVVGAFNPTCTSAFSLCGYGIAVSGELAYFAMASRVCESSMSAIQPTPPKPVYSKPRKLLWK